MMQRLSYRYWRLFTRRAFDEMLDALKKLEQLSPMDMSPDKVKVIIEHRQEKENETTISCTDYLTEKARSTLSAYD